MQIILVAENPDHSIHAAAALARCGGVKWIEVDDCAAAMKLLHSQQTDLVLFLLCTSALDGLSKLRVFGKDPYSVFAKRTKPPSQPSNLCAR